jgi:hypothetical protein
VFGGLRKEVALPLATPVRPDSEGRLVLADGQSPPEQYAVAIDGVALEGEPLDRVELGYELYGLRLWRLDQPARVSWIRTGIREDGDMHEPAVLTVWNCGGGRLELTLLPKLSTRVELRLNGEEYRTIQFAGEEFVNTTVFAQPGADTCRFEVVPDSLLGSTRFEFVRD